MHTISVTTEYGIAGSETAGAEPPTVLRRTRSMNTEEPSAKERTDVKPWRDEETLRYYYIKKELAGTAIADKVGCSTGNLYKWLNRCSFDVDRTGPKAENDDLLRDADWLREQYVKEDKSQRQIAEEINRDQWNVGQWLRRHGIETRYTGSRKQYPLLSDRKWLKTEYVEKERSMLDIADEVGCDETTVLRALRDHKIETRIHGSLPGKDCPNYIDGRSRERRYGGGIWQRARREVLERDGWECQRCGLLNHEHEAEYGRGLEVHHIIPFRTFDELEAAHDTANLVTLCRPCHKTMEGLPIDNREREV